MGKQGLRRRGRGLGFWSSGEEMGLGVWENFGEEAGVLVILEAWVW